MSRYLTMLKNELQKQRQSPVTLALSKLPKPPFDGFDSMEGGRICEKNDPSDRDEPLPVWCSKFCSCLEKLDLPDGKVMGCVQESPAWEQEWKRLSSMRNCPLRSGKRCLEI